MDIDIDVLSATVNSKQAKTQRYSLANIDSIMIVLSTGYSKKGHVPCANKKSNYQSPFIDNCSIVQTYSYFLTHFSFVKLSDLKLFFLLHWDIVAGLPRLQKFIDFVWVFAGLKRRVSFVDFLRWVVVFYAGLCCCSFCFYASSESGFLS